MFKAFLFVNSILSFIIGGMIFLTGIGAIIGCAGGLILLLVGSVIAFSAVSDFLKFDPEKKSSKLNDVIELIKKNGKWSASF